MFCKGFFFFLVYISNVGEGVNWEANMIQKDTFWINENLTLITFSSSPAALACLSLINGLKLLSEISVVNIWVSTLKLLLIFLGGYMNPCLSMPSPYHTVVDYS